ncbi:MAG TPA: hypothetical protein VH682_24710 [Gemmataceae bacterium]|jgi:hypothetical protein
MRKLFWCGLAAGVLAFGSLFTATYYAYREPDSVVGHCITTAANASVAVQPVTELASMVAQASRLARNTQETAGVAGCNEECIPEDPKPIAPEPVTIAVVEKPAHDVEPEAAPIVIHEDDPLPEANEEQAVPATIEITGLPNSPDNVCPMVMPYCTDDDEQSAVKRVMPYAEDDGVKPAAAIEESEDNAFKEWMKLIEGSDQSEKDGAAEELPAPKEEPSAEELPVPKEEPSAEPKCQEDSRIHEHYSGCPSMTCPYTGKSYPSHAPSMKRGKEESSEEPALHHRVRKHPGKGCKGEDDCPHPEGVDTMEYRPSDGGLNEYGPGPM